MTLVRFDQVPAADWQPKLGQLGGVVTDLDDVDQCIQVIAETPVGSCPLEPLFGSRLHLYVDAPLTAVAPDLVREMTEALQIWEPRIIVMQVIPGLAEDGSVELAVTWAPVAQPQQTRNTAVKL